MIMNLMYISMRKQKEDDNFVWYRIEVQAKENDDFDYKPLFGVFRFKKKPFLHKISKDFNTEDFIVFIEKETDPLLLLDQKNKIVAKCLVVMNKHLKEGFFPDKTCLATG